MVETQTHGQSLAGPPQTVAVRVAGRLRTELQLACGSTVAITKELAVEAGAVVTAANVAMSAATITTATVVADMAQILPGWASAVAIALALLLLIAAIALAGRGRMCRTVELVATNTADQPAEPVEP